MEQIIGFPTPLDAAEAQAFHDRWERLRPPKVRLEMLEPAPSAREQEAVSALRMIREITGATQSRPYTALSEIDQIARMTPMSEDDDTYGDQLTVLGAYYANGQSAPKAAASLRETARGLRQRADRLDKLAVDIEVKHHPMMDLADDG